jgi:protein involved in polysaccharide export with SLBB domain/beta-lactamase regulating signal transducer with metallopeptidase domain
MAWSITFYQGLVQLATTSLLLLIVSSAVILAIRQPARRIRVIQWTLAGLLVVPVLAFVHGYPRWSILPTLYAPASPQVVVERMEPSEQTEAWPSVAIEPNAEPMEDPIDEVLTAPDVQETFVRAEIETAVHARATPRSAMVPIAPQPKWEFALPRDFRFWIVIVYLSGVVIMALWSLVGLVALKLLLRSARPADAACRDLLREIAGPRSERVALVVSARAGQPCAFAWRPATIVLPRELCISEDSQKLRWALAHEWSHVERGDVWSWSLSGVVRWFYFYQPLLWWLRRQLQLSQDFVADSQAAHRGQQPEDYAEFLTFRAANFSRPTWAAGLGIGGRNSDLKRRVVMLVENRHPLEIASPRKWNLAAFPIAILMVAAVACLGEQPAGAGGEPAQATAAEPQAEAAKPAIAEATQPVEPVGPQAEASKPVVAEAPSGGKPAARQAVPAKVRPPAQPRKIAPGDVEGAEMERLGLRVPAQPRKIAPGDVLIVDVIPNIEGSQDGQARVLLRPEMKLEVDENGNISFGSLYGVVSVQGATLGGAQKEIQEHLLASQNLSHINVRVTFAREPAIVTPVIVQSPQSHVQAAPPVPAVPDPERIEFLEKMLKKGYVTPQEVAKAKGEPQPRRIKSGDIFNIEVDGTPDDHPVKPVVSVDADGRVALGAHYGKVNIKGKTVDEAEAAIREFLLKTLRDPKVQLTYRDAETPSPNLRGVRPVAPKRPTVSPYLELLPNSPKLSSGPPKEPKVKSWAGPNDSNESPASPTPPRIKPGDILDIEIAGGLLDVPPRMVAVVESSGKVALGVHYGRVEVRGKTLEEAEEAITKSLSTTIKEPQVQVTYWRAADGERLKSDETSKVKQLEREINELKSLIQELKAGKSPSR